MTSEVVLFRWSAAVLAAAIVVIGLMFATRAVGGADPYGYVSQADLWLAGSPKVDEPWMADVPWSQRRWAFAPMGHRPLDEAGRLAIVPTFPSGLPMLMAAAKWIGGACAVFWVVPLCGGIMVLATYGIGRRLNSARAGAIAAWLVATSPVFLFMLMAPMTDVPVAAAWASVFYFLLRPTMASTAAGGLVAAAAIVIRPNLVHLAAVMGLWLLVRANAGGDRWSRLKHASVFSLAAAPGILATAAINHAWCGSATASGYGRASDLFAWANVVPNMTRYVTWMIGSQTPIVLLGVAALAIPLVRVWPGVADRRIFGIIGLFVVGLCAPYAAYGNVDDVWWMLRYLLPIWPFVMIGLASVALAISRGRPMVAGIVTIAIVVLGLNGLRLATTRHVFELWKEARRFVGVAKIVQSVTEPNSVIFSREHSGSLRYYAGRMTIRFDAFDEDWLDRGIPWLASHGAHPYLVLDDFELARFRRHFAGQAAAAVVDRPPLVIYQGTLQVYLYDLLAAADPSRVPDTIVETFTGPRCLAPAPPPRLILK